ncbi:hypothetical protein [Burkholderia sp. Ac-20349]|uniref:hypothetical protein n=1 Tax=Burkholderia sp. Ac-20349 TaxID=2703893 RepID=UPI00197B1ADB|nr:hypothetical protein [Burkholderia sp. Ac-20349]MBN3839223.1 hypothetical protein [Burkholderia sp. Ac-20349]
MERTRERLSGAERVEKHRKKVLSEGGRRTTVTIRPEAVLAAEELVELGYAGDLTKAINKALIDARKRLE